MCDQKEFGINILKYKIEKELKFKSMKLLLKLNYIICSSTCEWSKEWCFELII